MNSNRMVENYFRFMRDWDTSAKRHLITKLTASISEKSKDEFDFSSCFGAWEDSRSAEDIADDLRSDRVNHGETEDWLYCYCE